MRDGSILFSFSDSADSSSAADAASGGGTKPAAAAEAAPSPGDSTTASHFAAEPQPEAAPQITQAAHEPESSTDPGSSTDDSPAETEAVAAGSQSQSLDKGQLQDLKVRFGRTACCVQDRHCLRGVSLKAWMLADQTLDMRSGSHCSGASASPDTSTM